MASQMQVELTFTKSTLCNSVKSLSCSKRFVEVAVKACVINILYHRLPIDKKEFMKKSFNQIPYMTFKSKSKNPIIRNFHSWMIAFKKAFNDSLVKQFRLYFQNGTTNDIEEYYSFQFKYANDKNFVQEESETLEQAANDLFNDLLCLEKLDKLDENIKTEVEIHFYDEIPEDYALEGFVPTEKALKASLNKTDVFSKLILGQLNTGFQSFICMGNIKTNLLALASVKQTTIQKSVTEMEEKSENDGKGSQEVENINVIPIGIFDETDLDDTSQKRIIEKPDLPKNVYKEINAEILDIIDEFPNSYPSNNVEDNKIKSASPTFTNVGVNDTLMGTDDLSVSEHLGSEMEKICFCECNIQTDLVQCSICDTKYHVFCVGYFKTEQIKEYKCFYCVSDDHDLLSCINSSEHLKVARIRAIMALLYLNKQIPTNLIPGDILKEYLGPLRGMQILLQNDDGSDYINQEKLGKVIKNYFNKEN